MRRGLKASGLEPAEDLGREVEVGSPMRRGLKEKKVARKGAERKSKLVPR